MSIYFKQLLLFLSVLTFHSGLGQANLKLWYEQPAREWNEALPIGNGRIGAMVFGGTEREQLQLNEETVWSGEPGNNIPENFKSSLPEIRKLINEGKYRDAQQLADQTLPKPSASGINYGMCYQPVGNLYFDFPGHDEATDYYRDLDIENAIASVSYQVGKVKYSREMFTSFPDDVLVVRIESSQPGGLTGTISVQSPHVTHQVSVNGDMVILTGVSGDLEGKKGKVKFEAIVQPRIEGGSVEVGGNSISISNADAATLFVSIGTNFINYKDISGDEHKKAQSIIKAISDKKYKHIKQEHINAYQKYFNRVSLDLGETEQSKKPTDQRITEFSSTKDPHLAAMYFQYGRYLLISSSQPGTQPATLQGIWNHLVSPPWDSKYTININTEMNYWPAEGTNLSEMHEPLFDMLRDLSQTGMESASKMYGARGWNVHHNTDIWRITGPVDGAFYGLWPMGGAWLSQHLWQHYLYTGDQSFLEEVYPILKGAAVFYVDILEKEPDNGWLVVNPSMSPENAHQNGVSITGEPPWIINWCLMCFPMR